MGGGIHAAAAEAGSELDVEGEVAEAVGMNASPAAPFGIDVEGVAAEVKAPWGEHAVDGEEDDEAEGEGAERLHDAAGEAAAATARNGLCGRGLHGWGEDSMGWL